MNIQGMVLFADLIPSVLNYGFREIYTPSIIWSFLGGLKSIKLQKTALSLSPSKYVSK